MSNNSQNRKGKPRSNKKRSSNAIVPSNGPPPNITVYRGPIDSPSLKESTDCHTFLINYTGTLASSAAGVLNAVIIPSNQCSSSANWASLIGLFSEWRILGFKFNAMPINPYAVAATQFPIFTVIDRSSSAALTSLNDAAAYASSQQHVLNRGFKRTAKMSDVGEADWTYINSTPTEEFYLKMYASGLANSTNYFQYLGSYLVQFKGIK